MDETLRALADPTRRRILQLLRKRSLSSGEIAERFDLARSTLSEHLGVLREAGLVVTERQGTTIRYSLHVAALEEAAAAVMDVLHVGRGREIR